MSREGLVRMFLIEPRILHNILTCFEGVGVAHSHKFDMAHSDHQQNKASNHKRFSTMTPGSTRARALNLFLSAFSVAARTVSAVDLGSGTSCIGSLDVLRSQEQLVVDDSTSRTYILCPNTEFEVAEVLLKGQAYSDGQSPILVGKSNLRIQCGEDGSSDNNCILTGGVYQLGFFRISSTEFADFEAASQEPIVNASIHGLTFKSAKTFNILAEGEGDLTIVGCVFEENQNLSPIFASIDKSGRRLHEMLDDEVVNTAAVAQWVNRRSEETRREMQTSNSYFHLTVADSLFLV